MAVTADKAYDSEKIRQQIKDEGALPVIPNRCSAIKKAYCPKRFYRRRHENRKLLLPQDWRRIAARYDNGNGYTSRQRRSQEGGIEAPEDSEPKPRRIWNNIPDEIGTTIVFWPLGPVAA